MVDLVSQYNKIKPEVNKALEGVMNSAAFVNGPEVQMFKKELAEYAEKMSYKFSHIYKDVNSK